MDWNYFSLWHRCVNPFHKVFYTVNIVIEILFRFPDISRTKVSRLIETHRVKYYSCRRVVFPVGFFSKLFIHLFSKPISSKDSQYRHSWFLYFDILKIMLSPQETKAYRRLINLVILIPLLLLTFRCKAFV